MKKAIVILITGIILIASISVGVMANTVPASNHATVTQSAPQTPASHGQTDKVSKTAPKNADTKTKTTPSKTTGVSRMTKVRTYLETKLVNPIKSGWHHLKAKFAKHNKKATTQPGK
jgi:hypothetical protein